MMQGEARRGTTLVGCCLWLKEFMEGTCVWFSRWQALETYRACGALHVNVVSKSQAKKVCQTRLVERNRGLCVGKAGHVVILAGRTSRQLYGHHFQCPIQKKFPPTGDWPKRERVQVSPKRNSQHLNI